MRSLAPISKVELEYWMSGCGSFACSGFMGSVDDKLTRAYLACGRGAGQYPDRIKMSRNVFEYYVRATGNLCSTPTPPSSTLSEIIDYVVRLIADGRMPSLKAIKFYDAAVSWSTDIPDGVALLYFGEELVGETSGWLA